MEMPDKIYAIKGVTNRFDGVWDNYQWSTQKGTEYHHSRIVEALRKENEELKAKLDKAKWQPIETAPKDGTMILVCLPRMMNLVIRARYNTLHNHWMDENYIDKDGEYNRGVSRFAYYHEGDLWCHIPDAPEQL